MNPPIFVYDLDRYPATNDLLFALVNVTLLCEEFLLDCFDIVILYGFYGYASPRNGPDHILSNDWRCLQMLTPLPWCFPRCRSVKLYDMRKQNHEALPQCDFVGLRTKSEIIRNKNRQSSLHRTKITLDYFLKGFEICMLAPPASAFFHKPQYPYITISLRSSDFQPLRNSNIPVIYNVCRYIVSLGIAVFVIPDYQDYHAEELYRPLRDYVHHEATCNPIVRLSLYDGAICSLGACNGLYTLAWLIDRPYLAVMPTMDFHCASESFLCANYGIRKDDSFLWSKLNQRLIWGQESESLYIEYIDQVVNHSRL